MARFIEDNHSVMMSDDLQGNLRDEGADDPQGKFIICILTISAGSSTETVVGTIVSCSSDSSVSMLHVRIMSEDAFSLIEAWQKIKIEKYQLSLGNDIIDFSGPFSVTSFAIRDVDVNRQLCAIEMKLEKV